MRATAALGASLVILAAVALTATLYYYYNAVTALEQRIRADESMLETMFRYANGTLEARATGYLVVTNGHAVKLLPLRPGKVSISIGPSIKAWLVHGLAVKPLEEAANISGIEEELRRMEAQLNNTEEQMTWLKNNISALAYGVVDPTLLAMVEDPNAINAYRGLVKHETQPVLPTARLSGSRWPDRWNPCAAATTLTISYAGSSVAVKTVPEDCNGNFKVLVDDTVVARISRTTEIEYGFRVGGLSCTLVSVEHGYDYIITIGGYYVGKRVYYAFPVVSCTGFRAEPVKDWVGWSLSTGDEYEVRLQLTYRLPAVTGMPATAVEVKVLQGYSPNPRERVLWVIAGPYGSSMTVKAYRDDDPAWGEGYFVETSGGTIVGDVNGVPVYATRTLTLVLSGNGGIEAIYGYVRVG